MHNPFIHFSRISKPGICLAVLIGLIFGCASGPPGDKRGSASRLITDLFISQDPEALVVTIKANRSITYTSDRLEFPMGVLLYFPDTGLSLTRRVYTLSDNETINSIKANEVVEGKTTGTRIFIVFKKDTAYELSADADRLQIKFPKTVSPPVEPKPQEKPVETTPPTTSAAPEVPPAPAARRLTKVTATPLKNTIAVNIIADGTIENYNSFSLDHPGRIVFDLYGLKSPYSEQQIIGVESRWVKRIRYYGHPDKVRLVIETTDDYQNKYSAVSKDTGLLIYVGDVPAAGIATGPAETNEDMETRDVTLTWGSVPGAVSYNVYWSESPGVNRLNGNKITDIKSPRTTVKGLKPGNTYYFVVTAVKGSAESPESEEITFTVGK